MILLFLACATDDRALLQVPVTLHPSSAQTSPVDDVAVTIASATITFSDLRFESPAEEEVSWKGFSLIGTAYAHPGHDFAGDVAGELTGTWTADLLAPDLELGIAGCYEGDYATGRVTVVPDPIAVVEGTATVGDATFPFRFESAPDQEITGLEFDVVIDAAAPPSGIGLTVDLGHALSYVDWTTPDGDEDGVLTSADGKIANSFSFGVVSTPTWQLGLED